MISVPFYNDTYHNYTFHNYKYSYNYQLSIIENRFLFQRQLYRNVWSLEWFGLGIKIYLQKVNEWDMEFTIIH